MTFSELPKQAAWRHEGARVGFENLFVDPHGAGHVLRGHTTAVEDGLGWSVGYTIEVDARWRTLRAAITGRTVDGELALLAERREGDRWLVNGSARPDLDGLVDIDLESSSVTNTLPVHRLDLLTGVTRQAPAVFVRAYDLGVEILNQTYTALEGDGRFAYECSTFDVACELTYDAAGLILDYPGIATRIC